MTRGMKIGLGVLGVLAVLWFLGRRSSGAAITGQTGGAAAQGNNVIGIVGSVSDGLAKVVSALRPGQG